MSSSSTASILREVARLYAHAQRSTVACCNGTSSTQCHILTELDRWGEMSLSELGTRLSLEKSWMGRAVDRLVQEGLLLKESSSGDKRITLVSLSSAGKSRTKSLNRTLDSQSDRIMSRIPEPERAAAVRSLQLILAALKAEIDAPLWRRATAADAPSVEALLASAKLPLEGVREHIEHFLVAHQGCCLVAAIGVEPYRSAGLLRSAVVAEGQRNKGWGRLLVEQLIADSKERGWKELILLTETAREYFESFGFRVVSRDDVPADVKKSAEFRGACPVSAIVMKLNLKEK